MKLVDSNFRVSIPSELRKKYNIKPGDSLDIIDTGNTIEIRSYNKKYEVDESDMKKLRRLYLMLKNSGILDDFYANALSKITQETDMKCTICNENMFLTASNEYKCYKCD